MRLSMILAACASVALAGAAQAAPVLSFGTLGDLNGATLFANYDSLTPTPSGGVVEISPPAGIPGQAAPVGSGNFGYVTGGSDVSYSFAQPVSSFSLDVGSPDLYNSVSLSLVDGQTVSYGNFTGPADRYIFTAANSDYITGVTLASGQNSFEFDNLATTAVPEPVTWAMMIGGFGLVGGMMRRARRQSENMFARKVRSFATA